MTSENPTADLSAGYYLIIDIIKDGSGQGHGDAVSDFVVEIVGNKTFTPKATSVPVIDDGDGNSSGDTGGEEDADLMTVTLDDLKTLESIPAGTKMIVKTREGETLAINDIPVETGAYTLEEDGEYKVTITDMGGNTYIFNITIIINKTEHVHSYTETITKEPTCTEPGEKKLTCSCGDTKTEAIPAKGHNYQDGVCADCGDEESPHVHSYTEEIIKEPTCEEAGEKKLTCECGNTKTEIIPAKGHDYENGTCKNCGGADPDYSDEAPTIDGIEDGGTYKVGKTVSVKDGETLKVDGNEVSSPYTFNDEGGHDVEVIGSNGKSTSAHITIIAKAPILETRTYNGCASSSSASNVLNNTKYVFNQVEGTNGRGTKTGKWSFNLTMPSKGKLYVYTTGEWGGQEKIENLMYGIDTYANSPTGAFASYLGSSYSNPMTYYLDPGKYVIAFNISNLQPTKCGFFFKCDLYDDDNPAPADFAPAFDMGGTTASASILNMSDMLPVSLAAEENDNITDTVANDGENIDTTVKYGVGDSVPFKLTAVMPDSISAYKTYRLLFHDSMTDGLTYDEGSLKVFVGDTEIPAENYTVASDDGMKSFTVTINDAKVEPFNAVAGTEVSVKYTATLNDSAAFKNINNAWLEYSNNPNGEGTGTTVSDDVTAFTFTMDIDKVDKDGNALYGAGFTLYKKVENGETDTEDGYVKTGDEVTGGSSFEFTGLAVGDYKLVESTTPDGYNTMADLEFSVVADSTEDADGNAYVTGLKIVAQGGTLESDMLEGWASDTDTGILSADIANYRGSELPSTGGMGTTMFYATGGCIMAAVCFVLVKRRKSCAE